jgi:hypothetical protein
VAVQHDGHTDYLHDGHLHHVHGDHVDDHVLEVSAGNPATCSQAYLRGACKRPSPRRELRPPAGAAR